MIEFGKNHAISIAMLEGDQGANELWLAPLMLWNVSVDSTFLSPFSSTHNHLESSGETRGT